MSSGLAVGKHWRVYTHERIAGGALGAHRAATRPSLANIAYTHEDVRMSNAAALSPQTVDPQPGDEAQVIDFVAQLRARGLDAPEATARIVSSNGKDSLEIPEPVFRVLKFAAEQIAAGRGVTLVPMGKLLTTYEAASLLGISRPTLIKLLEGGEMDFTKVGRHRRIKLGDVLEHQRRLAEVRDEALQEMADIARESGLYEETAISGEGIR